MFFNRLFNFIGNQAQSNSCVIWIVFKFCHNRCPARLTKKATFIVIYNNHRW
jgi:hypothetical protein